MPKVYKNPLGFFAKTATQQRKAKASLGKGIRANAAYMKDKPLKKRFGKRRPVAI